LGHRTVRLDTKQQCLLAVALHARNNMLCDLSGVCCSEQLARVLLDSAVLKLMGQAFDKLNRSFQEVSMIMRQDACWLLPMYHHSVFLFWFQCVYLTFL